VTLVLLAGPAFGLRALEEDQFDVDLLQIDEGLFLGRSASDVAVTTESGSLALSELIDGKPTILLLAYYSCGHVCPAAIRGLAETQIDAAESDYQVVVLSFDHNDSLETLRGARSSLEKLPANWTFGLLAESESARLTESVGFRFFYSERDQLFIHPAVLVFLSPEGEIMRYLYGAEPRADDIDLALLESRKGVPRLNDIISMVKLACFQFDTAKSRYVVHPTFIFGGAGFGVLGLVGLAALASRKHSKGDP